MLPAEFVLHVTGLGRFVARDLPAGAFFANFPDEGDAEESRAFAQLGVPDRPEVEGAWRRWGDGVLVAAIVRPPLTPALLVRLADDRDHLLLRYFHAVGWLEGETEVEAAPAADSTGPAMLRLPLRPPPAVRPLLLRLASHGLWPSRAWQMPVSEFLFNLRALGAPEEM